MPTYLAPRTDPFQINVFGNDRQTAPDLAPLASGGFAASWNTLPANSWNVAGRIYGADGVALGDEVVLATDVGSSGGFADMTGLPSGAFFAAYTEFGADSSIDGITGRFYGPAGGAAGEGFLVNTTENSTQRHAGTALLSTGQVIAVWFDGSTLGISGQALAQDGTPVGAEFAVDASDPRWSIGQLDVAALTGGGFVVTWHRDSGSNEGLFAQVFQGPGIALGPAFEVPTTTGGLQRYPAVAGLSGGGFVVAWQSAEPGSLRETVFYQVYDAAGAPVGAEGRIPSPIGNGDFMPAVTARDDGGFVISYYAAGAADGSAPRGYFLQEFTAGGAAEGGALRVTDDTSSSLGPAPVIELDNGDLAVAWVSFNDTGSGGDGANILGRLITEAGEITGTGDADHLVGAFGDDLLRGLAGNDTIEGRDGSDTLVGGEGDDALYGGNSTADLRDVIYGGNGNDLIDGGHGNDELRGDAGRDTISGGHGADTVIGGAGDDVLTGQAFGDAIFGGDGFDFINGGFGHDRLNGGAQGDTFFHLGVLGHGSDWIQDFSTAEGDRLQFGGAGATAADFQVNFTETANAGQAGVQEAFVIYKPGNQILWALVDGSTQDEIDIVIGGQTFDLLA